MDAGSGQHGSSGTSRSMLRRALAGGLAGSFATMLLYPIDTVKTMRQSDRTLNNIGAALSILRARGIMKIYAGLLPATIGSFASSAIYFGSYEAAKQLLQTTTLGPLCFAASLGRQGVHMLAAASGNVASSLVFVPKDALKQQLQALRTGSIMPLPGLPSPLPLLASKGSAFLSPAPPASLPQVVRYILQTRGLKGFYPSYRATLLRNIPSAVVRFTVYEELRLVVLRGARAGGLGKGMQGAGFLLVGGLASALSSALTTPLGAS